MENKIEKLKLYYQIFLILTLFGLIDIATASIFEVQYKMQDVGVVTFGLYYALGKTGLIIGLLLRGLFIVFGLIAIILNRKIKKLKATTTSQV